MPCRFMGVSLSHLILLSVTSSDSSPIRLHVREYVCPSIENPFAAMTRVSGGAVFLMNEAVHMA